MNLKFNIEKGIILSFVISIAFVQACSDSSSNVNVPVITSFTPLRARVDAIITIYGKNFSEIESENIVRINGVECPKISSSSTEIKIKAIPGVNSGRISLTVSRFAAISNDDFTLATHSFKFDPENGVANDVVNFTAYNFSDLPDSVTVRFFDSLVVNIYDYTALTDTSKTFKATVPTGASTGNIIVEIGGIEVESDTVFTIDE